MHFKHLVCAPLVIAAAALAACQGPDADQVRETEQAWVGVVDEGDGCTLTQGYWKNHDESWPVSSLTIGGDDYSAEELLDLPRTPTKGDASLILGHQLIAALLNVASGAGTPQDVADALAAADAWMAAAANQDADGRLPYTVKSGPAASDATALADTLAQFNEGSIGPGHCGDGPGTSSSSSSGSTSASSATSSATSSGSGGAGGSGGGTTSSSSTTSGAGGSGGGTTCTKPCTPSVIVGQCSSDEMCIEGCCVPVPAIDFN